MFYPEHRVRTYCLYLGSFSLDGRRYDMGVYEQRNGAVSHGIVCGEDDSEYLSGKFMSQGDPIEHQWSGIVYQINVLLYMQYLQHPVNFPQPTVFKPELRCIMSNNTEYTLLQSLKDCLALWRAMQKKETIRSTQQKHTLLMNLMDAGVIPSRNHAHACPCCTYSAQRVGVSPEMAEHDGMKSHMCQHCPLVGYAWDRRKEHVGKLGVLCENMLDSYYEQLNTCIRDYDMPGVKKAIQQMVEATELAITDIERERCMI